jgi:CRP/FNR family cyclic AMP-dependent transcriptional regulator
MNTKLLNSIPLFETLNEAETEILASRIELRQWPENSLIIREGDESNSLFIILSGKVKIFLQDESGEEIILNFLREGDYFGEVSLFGDGERSASVITLSDAYFAVLEKDDFVELMASHPKLALTIIQGATHRLQSLSNNVRSLAANW